MKLRNKYIFGILTLASLLSGCIQEDVPTFDKDSDAVYFPENKKDLTKRVNLGNIIPTDDSEDTKFIVQIKLMGRMYNQPRKVTFGKRAIEGYDMPEFTIPEVVFQKGEVIKDIEFVFKKPAELNKEYGVTVFISSVNSEETIGGGVLDHEEVTFYIKESYDKPNNWEPFELKLYFGDWNPTKHRMLLAITKQQNYALQWNPRAWGVWNTEMFKRIRKKAEAGENIEELNVPVPRDANHNYKYGKPYYWTELHDKYLGAYLDGSFTVIAKDLKLNTLNEKELLSLDEEGMKNLNKKAVKLMMLEYNKFFNRSNPVNVWKQRCWFPVIKDTDYEVVAPASWKGDFASNKIKKYYGDYSEAKYKFMIKTWLEKVGEENFFIGELFPVLLSYTNTGIEDNWDEGLGGEEKIKECYAFLKAKAIETGQSFTFPNVEP